MAEDPTRPDVKITEDTPLGWSTAPTAQIVTGADGLRYQIDQARAVRAHSQFLFPGEVDRYTEWARTHPTADPRFWIGLANAGIHPASQLGQDAALADITRQIQEGTYLQEPGSPVEAPRSRTPAKDVQRTSSKDSGKGSMAPGQYGQGSLTGLGTGFDAYGVLKNAVNWTFGLLSTGYDALTAPMKAEAGQESEKDRIAEEYGLEGDEVEAAFGGIEPEDSGGLDISGVQPTLLPRPEREWLTPDDIKDPARRRVVQEARAAYEKWLKSPEGTVTAEELAKTTWLGQVAADPSLLTETYETGSALDLETGQWVDPTTGEPARRVPETGWLPSQTIEQQKVLATINIADIRTLEEQARGLAPVAWTPGRALAHIWYSPDEANFNLISGLADAGAVLTLDPVNLIPMNFGPKIFRGAVAGLRSVPLLGDRVPILAGEAFSPSNLEKVVVAAPAPRGPKDFSAVRAAEEAAREGKTVKAARQEVPTILDKSLNNHVLGPDGKVSGITDEGLVNTPTSKFIVNKLAWEWLQSGRGARVVTRIAEIDNFYDMYHMLGGQRSNIPVDIIKVLVKANSEESVRAALGTRLGVTLTDHSPFGALGAGAFRQALGYGVNGAMLDSVGLFSKGGRQAFTDNREMLREQGVNAPASVARSLTGAYRRPFRLAPRVGHSVDARDKDALVEALDAFGRGGRLTREELKDGINRVVDANPGPELYQALYGDGADGNTKGVLGFVLRDVLVRRFGMEESEAVKLSMVFQGGLDEKSRNVLTRDLNYGAGIDGVDQIGHTQLLGESLSNSVHLPAYSELTRATRVYSNVKRLESLKSGSDWVADLLQGFTTFWRNGVLVRPAYIPREIGELLFAMSLAGGRSAFTHPARFAASMWQIMVALEFKSATMKMVTAPVKMTDALAKKGFDALADMTLDAAYAYRDFAHLSLGMQRLAPLAHQRAARVIGDGQFDAINRALEAGDMEKLQEFAFQGLASVSGSKQIDQGRSISASRYVYAAMRDAARGTRERRDYLNDLTHKVWILSGDNQMRDLANKDLTFEQTLERFRASKDIEQLRIMHPDQLTDDPESEVQYLLQYQDWLRQVTGEDPELMDAVATGVFRDEQLRPVGTINNPRAGANPTTNKQAEKASRANRALTAHLDSLTSEEATREAFPKALTGYRGKTGRTAATLAGDIVDSFFEATGGFADIFARGPMFREAYADRVIEMVPHMTAAAKANAVRNLREAGDYALAMKVQNTRLGKGGFLGIDEVDTVALGYAQKESKRIFYDASRRQNYAVMLRVIGPFLQATTNTFRRWGQMSFQNPQMMYRTLRPIHALHQPGSAAIYQIFGEATGDEVLASLYDEKNPQHYYTPGLPETTVDGFFFTDSYGEKRFAFPIVGRVAQLLGQEDSLFTANASGLNVAGNSISPGLGPILTFSQSQVITPGMLEGDNLLGEALRFANPYGLPEGGLADEIVQSALPTWARKGFQGTTDEYQANATVRLIPALAASGNYDMTSQADVARMIGDAKRLSGSLSVMGMIATAILPASTNAERGIPVEVEDGDGMRRRIALQDTILKEFRRYTATDYSGGMVRFVEDFGMVALFAVLPKTKAKEGSELLGNSTSDDVWQFRTDHPEAYEKHSDVIGLFFAGGDPDSEFSQNLYRWQKAEGERVPKTPEEFVDDANQALGWMLWDAANNALVASGMNDDERRERKNEIRRELQDKFPGWTGKAKDLGRFDVRMDKLIDALEDPEIQGLASSKPIADYIATRSDLIGRLEAETGSVDLNTNKAAPYREELLRVADVLAAEDTSGGFMVAWDRLFSYEFDWEN